jgi:hypothetical protein
MLDSNFAEDLNKQNLQQNAPRNQEETPINTARTRPTRLPRPTHSSTQATTQPRPVAVANQLTLFSLFTYPIVWGLKLLYKFITFVSNYVPFIRRNQIRDSNPIESAERYRAEFIQKYGQIIPDFYIGSYTTVFYFN